MTTHIGKIGRLPKGVRNELGRRIEDGVPGTVIVSWLNGLREVKELMDEYFGFREITEQNLSEWRKTGHVEWLRRQEAKEAAVRLLEEADDLEEATQEMSMSDRFAIVLAAEMTRLAATLLEAEADLEKRWKRLCEINRELSQLRRDDHRAVRESIRQERWRREQGRDEEERAAREAQEAKSRRIDLALSPAFNHEVAKMFGGGEAGKEVAERLHGIRFNLAESGKRESEKAETESEGIQANPGSANGNDNGGGRRPTATHKGRESRLIQANPRDEMADNIEEIVEADMAWDAAHAKGGRMKD